MQIKQKKKYVLRNAPSIEHVEVLAIKDELGDYCVVGLVHNKDGSVDIRYVWDKDGKHQSNEDHDFLREIRKQRCS